MFVLRCWYLTDLHGVGVTRFRAAICFPTPVRILRRKVRKNDQTRYRCFHKPQLREPARTLIKVRTIFAWASSLSPFSVQNTGDHRNFSCFICFYYSIGSLECLMPIFYLFPCVFIIVKNKNSKRKRLEFFLQAIYVYTKRIKRIRCAIFNMRWGLWLRFQSGKFPCSGRS